MLFAHDDDSSVLRSYSTFNKLFLESATFDFSNKISSFVSSAFDALFAELMVGKNLMASSFINASATATAKPATAPAPQTQKKENATFVQKTPRFALELDGLHCFETIVRS
ncbi:unnamed protein product [Microthlaspi erraticum]|uniref:Uncharacterized protein n=1 Tax=Microthlaspi erraticum TaxID=1685480 RepID=A0A6D2KY58_9BRAS|nr:unnamed protein product [Microthlaspi erraticum]